MPSRTPVVGTAIALAVGLSLPAAASPRSARSTDTRTVVATKVIGHSVRGRSIVAHELGNPDNPTKVLVMAAMHGDEMGPSHLISDLVHGAPVRGADVWVIRTANPDGSARHTRQNAHGVDLNRNFPRRWQRAGGTYDSGPRPASEPETRALMRFLTWLRPRYVISFHQPLHGVGRSGLSRGRGFQRRLSRGLHLPLKWFNCDGGCHGTMTEWFNHEYGHRVALTVEYGAHLTSRQLRTAPDAILHAVGAHHLH